MLMTLILVTGILIGILPGLLKLGKAFNITNMAVGLIGALAGAFPCLGDAPLILQYSFVNEITFMVAVSFLFVAIKILIARKGKAL